MDDVKHPTEGGSYVRDQDGSLKKVDGTEPAPPPAAPPAPPIANTHEEQ